MNFIKSVIMKKLDFESLSFHLGGTDKETTKGIGCGIALISACALVSATGLGAFIGVAMFTYGSVMCATGAGHD